MGLILIKYLTQLYTLVCYIKKLKKKRKIDGGGRNVESWSFVSCWEKSAGLRQRLIDLLFNIHKSIFIKLNEKILIKSNSSFYWWKSISQWSNEKRKIREINIVVKNSQA